MAKGSHTTWAGWEPRHCTHCGQKITHKTGGCHHFDHRDQLAWSTCTNRDCIRKGRPTLELS